MSGSYLETTMFLITPVPTYSYPEAASLIATDRITFLRICYWTSFGIHRVSLL